MPDVPRRTQIAVPASCRQQREASTPAKLDVPAACRLATSPVRRARGAFPFHAVATSSGHHGAVEVDGLPDEADAVCCNGVRSAARGQVPAQSNSQALSR